MSGKYVLHHEYQAAQHVILLTTKYPDPQGAGCTVARTRAITGSAGSPAASASLAKKNLASSWRAGVSLDCSMKALRIRVSAACKKKPEGKHFLCELALMREFVLAKQETNPLNTHEESSGWTLRGTAAHTAYTRHHKANSGRCKVHQILQRTASTTARTQRTQQTLLQ